MIKIKISVNCKLSQSAVVPKGPDSKNVYLCKHSIELIRMKKIGLQVCNLQLFSFILCLFWMVPEMVQVCVRKHQGGARMASG